MPTKRILTEKDIDELESRFKNVFLTKEEFEEFKEELDRALTSQRSDLMEKLDSILKEILVSREEQTILAHRSSNHEDRITNLESKVSISPVS